MSLSNSNMNGAVLADRFGMYPPRYVTLPNTRCNSVALVGVGVSVIAWIFSPTSS